MKKQKINLIIYIIMLVLTLIFVGFIIYANMIPTKYLLLIIGLLAVWLAVIGFLLHKKNKKSKIIGYIMFVISLIIMSIGFYYINSTLGFFKYLDKDKYKEEKFLVLVLDDSEYQKIDELKDEKIGYVPSELNSVGLALGELDKKISYEKNQIDNYDKLFEQLFDNSVEAIIIEESQKTLIEENTDHDHTVRILYTITIKTKLTEIEEVANITKDPFAIYITGIDTYGTINSVSRSDVNIVAVVNPQTKQVLLLSIPRDYYVQINGTTGLKDKLTHTGIYGVDKSLKTIEDLLETNISYYFKVNFTSVIKIVDKLDGIDVYSKYTFTTSKENSGHYRFIKGYNHMNGDQALAFSRERYNLPGGDRSRGENQQAVINGLINKATSKAIITKYDDILKSLKDSFQTNMTEKAITKLIKMQLNDMSGWNITSYSLDGKDSSQYTYSYPHQKLYVMVPNEEKVSEAIDLINRVETGEILEKSYGEISNIKNPSEITYPAPKPTPKPTPEPEKPVVVIKEPTISLVGKNKVVLLMNSIYEEPGVTVSVDVTDTKTKITDVKTTGNVDVTLSGEYTLTYTITDVYNKKASITRKIIVLDPLLDDDDDGVSNQKEIDEKTDPLDKNSFPPKVEKPEGVE